MNDKPTTCCLCDDSAVAIYYMSQGCVARPDLTVQPLCLHHERRALPLGCMEMIKDLRVWTWEEFREYWNCLSYEDGQKCLHDLWMKKGFIRSPEEQIKCQVEAIVSQW